MTAELETRLSNALDHRPTTESRRLIDERVAAMIDAEALRRSARPSRSGLRRRLVRPLLLAATLALLAAGSWAVMGMPPLGPNVMTAPNTAEQFDAEVAAAIRATDLPPGYTYPELRATDRSGGYGVGGGTSVVQFNAACDWFDYWRVSLRAGDTVATERAIAVINMMPTWFFYADPRAADWTLRAAFDGLFAAARAGNAAPIDTFETVNCGR